ncbi:PREDICTED: uncharacterized protein LOC105560907 [Vollenhovia emeryi]|uniref:uncharacterized protein LOC105560907 n=1 Tax=Vollenhovia emeryi TaxID=411798 RepID=UPI0005F58A6D|nr:PREDICTED: uncharacterized protein LOC105560907 [Vollenhovia emeryi]
MRRDKSVRTLCPRCGHDYGIRTRAESKLIAHSSECASSRGKLSDFANAPSCYLRAECGGSQPGHRQKTLSMGDEAARALRVSEERPRRGGGSRSCRSQSKLSRGYALCANQVTVSRRYRGIPYRVGPPSSSENIFRAPLTRSSRRIFTRRKFDTATLPAMKDIFKL